MFANENSPARSIRSANEWGNGVMEEWSRGLCPNTPTLQYSNNPIQSYSPCRLLSISQRCKVERGDAARQDDGSSWFRPWVFFHDAHLRLVRHGKKRGDRLVVSIFVNPAQFSPPKTLLPIRATSSGTEAAGKGARRCSVSPFGTRDLSGGLPDSRGCGQAERAPVRRSSTRPLPGVATVVAKLFISFGPMWRSLARRTTSSCS
jgi:hypothetical protein